MSESFRSPSKVMRRLKLAPLAARKLVSWPRFVFNYALGLVPRNPYKFRNGARLMIGRSVDHVPIIEIFLREEYGTVPDGAIVLDIGASIGTFSIYAATTARAVSIYSYEPLPAYFTLMQENVRYNRLDGAIKCFNFAVSADSHARQLLVENPTFMFPTLVRSEPGRTTRIIETACTTLPDILDTNRLDRVDILKMDCEGSEYDILYGTPTPYFDRIREIRMEYHNLPGRSHNCADLVAFLRRQGYETAFGSPTHTTQATGNIWARKHA